MSNGKFLTVSQFAEKSGFTPEYIRRMCVDGTINAQKFGFIWMISASELKKVKRQRFTQEQKDELGSKE